ncbi:formimidoylglutamate deiminase, partial [Caulobacter sp. D5]
RSGDALVDSLVFAGRFGAIDSVWRAGRPVVSGGRHRHREAIAERYRRVLKDLLS